MSRASQVMNDRRARAADGLVANVQTVCLTIAVILALSIFGFQQYYIPSGSLVPTLLVGDKIAVSKFAYGYSSHSFPFSPNLFAGRIWAAAPQRGDIVVFKLPSDPSVTFIKRLIGLPGDHIQMINGRLFINAEMVARKSAGMISINDPELGEVSAQSYVEILPGGVSHKIVEVDGDAGAFDNTAKFIVPSGHYFFMGDNRDGSLDSRASGARGGAGFVPFENLVGRAEWIYFSVKEGEAAWQVWRWPVSVRWDRVFTRIR